MGTLRVVGTHVAHIWNMAWQRCWYCHHHRQMRLQARLLRGLLPSPTPSLCGFLRYWVLVHVLPTCCTANLNSGQSLWRSSRSVSEHFSKSLGPVQIGLDR